MGKYMKAILLFLGIFLLSPYMHSQEDFTRDTQSQTIPEALRRPEMGEALRYPKDVVIGELGQGESPDMAYLFAKALLSALIAGDADAPELAGSGAVITENLKEEIYGIEPRSYHLGGGRIEADGSVSFLVRFLGREESITGEMYITNAVNPALDESEGTADADPASAPVPEEKWLLDDLVLEEKRPLSEIRDSYRYDFTPYERFY